MYLHFGQRPYGKCDVVPELFYVATWFFHINFIPLVPLGTRLILGKQGARYQVVRIPFSVKSLVYAWTRAATFVGMLCLGIVALVAYTDHHRPADAKEPALAGAFCAMVFALVMVYPTRKMPSYDRACRLAELAGLNDRGWAALNVLYGRDPFDRPSQIDAPTLR